MSSFFVPSHLRVQPDRVERVMLVGGCIFERWKEVLARARPGVSVDQIQFDYSGRFPAATGPCDFRIVQIPLRYLYPEVITMQARYDDPDSAERALARAFRIMRGLVEGLGGGDPDRPTFFLNYPQPQRSAHGRLMPRYDPRNPVFFIQRLNRQLSDLVDAYPGGHVLDLEQSAAAFGRRFMQDDPFWLFGHGGLIDDSDLARDAGRLEPSRPLSELHGLDIDGFIATLWDEAFAMLRTLRATDRVKLLCIDLDDTLWPGVLADADPATLGPDLIEGWPLGFAEALMILKQRGMILAIISKNDPARAGQIIDSLFGDRLSMADFAIRKINWLPKSHNMAEVIGEANVLPDSVVYIDDNPVERAAMKQAFPAIRVLDAPHRDWRRILLWSPETQVAAISAESASRTEMVRAQVAREEARQAMGHEAFLAELEVAIALRPIGDCGDASFARAIELLNKTNQFNTTGDRWSHAQASDHFAAGGTWWAFTARDRFTDYGLVGLLIVDGRHVRQFVMSCRVFGLGIEQAALATVEARVGGGMTAALLETDRNGPCRQVYADAGWTLRDGIWASPGSTAAPGHVTARIVDQTPAEQPVTTSPRAAARRLAEAFDAGRDHPVAGKMRTII